MANYTTSADICNDVLFRARELDDGSSAFQASVINFVNRSYRELQNGGGAFGPYIQEPWLWLRKNPPGVLTLNPAIVNVGTISATNGSPNITFTVDPFSGVSIAGRMIKFDIQPDVFRVLTHTGGSTSAVLDSPYTGLTASGLNYRCFQVEYTLANDVGEVLSPMKVQSGGMLEIDGTELYAMDRDWPIARLVGGVPTQFAMVSPSKVRFNKYGYDDALTSLIRVEYDYLIQPPDLVNSTADTPLVPLAFRHVLADMALYEMLLIKVDDPQDPRVVRVGKQAEAGIVNMSHSNRVAMVEFSRNYGRLLSRNDLRTRVRAPLRTQSGVIIG